MPDLLYLDTARLGTLSPGARRLHLEFVRLAAEQPSTLYFERFLRDGFASWPTEYQVSYPSLTRWQGINTLQRQLADLLAPGAVGRVCLASRSAALMRQAARLLCRRCRNVFTTDLSWPAYQRILVREARRCGTTVTRFRVRRPILRDNITPSDLARRITQAYRRRRCDGLFLPVVDNMGIQLPVRRIVETIRECADLRFVVGDAAQAFAHVPLNGAAAVCDVLIAGCHKWLGAYFPLGIAWLSGRLPQEVCSDPLARFIGAVSSGRLTRHGETVNLAPLIACQGALEDLAAANTAFQTQHENAYLVARIARRGGWTTVRPHPGFRTGIVLLRPPVTSSLTPDSLRALLLNEGVAGSTYSRGLVRLSMPRRPFRLDEISRLRRALANSATASREFHAISKREAALSTA